MSYIENNAIWSDSTKSYVYLCAQDFYRTITVKNK